MATQTIASDIEIIVLRWLDKKGIIDYEFQSSLMGGRYELGGAIGDVVFYERSLLWRVHGDYWHKQMSQRARDNVQQELLEAEGWQVVNIWGSSLETPEMVEETLSKALVGKEVL